MLKQLTNEEKQEPPLEHALKIRHALSQGNYGRLFKLYLLSPNMGGSLIDVFIDKIRVLSLRNLSMGYVATGIGLTYVTRTHAFKSNDETEKFLKTLGCVISEQGDEKRLDCRASIVALRKAPLKVKRAVK